MNRKHRVSSIRGIFKETKKDSPEMLFSHKEPLNSFAEIQNFRSLVTRNAEKSPENDHSDPISPFNNKKNASEIEHFMASDSELRTSFFPFYKYIKKSYFKANLSKTLTGQKTFDLEKNDVSSQIQPHTNLKTSIKFPIFLYFILFIFFCYFSS